MKPYFLILSELGFVLLTVVYFGFFLRELQKGSERAALEPSRKKKFIFRVLTALMLWGAFVSVWSASGMMGDFSLFPFNLMPVIAIPLVTVILLLFSGKPDEILKNIPVENLIRLQSFRFFVEILLWALFTVNLVPEQMTFEGRNFDILAGLTAPVVAWLAARQKVSRTVLIVWNLACLGLLINIVSVAILSTPSPLRVFIAEPPSTIVTRFPVSWLPGFLVPLAYTLHFFSLRQLLQAKPRKTIGLKEA